MFYAERNARTVKASAEYYRSVFAGRVSSWNLRDRHMADTLEALADHLTRQSGGDEPARIVVWAHNSHIGDCRATELGGQGELNVGQLVREQHPGDCRLIGFTTYTGSVTAADEWDGATARKRVRAGLSGSVEEMLHEVGEKEFLLAFDSPSAAVDALRVALLERAIGVVYRPDTERLSHRYGEPVKVDDPWGTATPWSGPPRARPRCATSTGCRRSAPSGPRSMSSSDRAWHPRFAGRAVGSTNDKDSGCTGRPGWRR